MLYLFVDTNFFLQCRDARELDWKKVFSDDISIFIPRAVMRELDSWKDKGNQRKGSRARNALKIINEVVNHGRYEVECKGLNISFVSHKRQDLTERREGTLDLTKADDLIVNEVLAWKEINTDKLVKVITGDINMRSTCKHCGVEFLTFPDDWYLPPENDAKDKKIFELENHLKQFQNRNPNLEIIVKSQYKFHGDCLVLTVPEYSPMEENMVQETAARIFSMFPLTKDFSVGYGKIGTFEKLLLRMDNWPPNPERIMKYEGEYVRWKENIFKFLRKIHLNAKYLFCKNGFPHLSFLLSNTGGAPAEDLIADFSVSEKEKLIFMEGLKYLEYEMNELPKVPKPPERGEYLQPPESGDYSSFGSSFITGIVDNLSGDMNKFYKKNMRNHRMVYECKQFRHHNEEKIFDFYFFPASDVQKIVNMDFRYTISASNIPFPIEKNIKISLTREIRPLDDIVDWFIEQLKPV